MRPNSISQALKMAHYYSLEQDLQIPSQTHLPTQMVQQTWEASWKYSQILASDHPWIKPKKFILISWFAYCVHVHSFSLISLWVIHECVIVSLCYSWQKGGEINIYFSDVGIIWVSGGVVIFIFDIWVRRRNIYLSNVGNIWVSGGVFIFIFDILVRRRNIFLLIIELAWFDNFLY